MAEELTRCISCGKVIYKKDEVCKHCGAVQKKQKKKKKHPILKTLLIAFAVIVVIGVVGSALGGGSGDTSNGEKSSQYLTGGTSNTEKTLKEEDSPAQPEINSGLDTSEYMKVDAEVLFEYGNYMQGEKVITAITIADVASGLLKANTDNNDSLFFSINCEFQDRDYPKQFEEGAIVTIAGEISDNPSPVGDTVVLQNCSVIGFGEIAEEIKAGIEEQRNIGEEYKVTYEKAVSDAVQAEKDDYISQCTTVKYSDVERNPDNYKGQKVKITGKVIQVSEGWFDSVTMRVSCSGDIWYVTYIRADGESRILEDDTITCYGECDGVTSYTTVLGSQVTIPSLKMKYHS